ncbi:transcriptional regulator CopG family [Candidatus Termititenax aidoneus]|uniref:Transcriptional regulator CopG family n=1 Tax=Termititenax aidoneus TaxID=2218524 RepID=A0A388T9Y8_TERA1|nr:transcriptional regulator CopG family [Candidatus Termititenax aidoneus]
MAKTITLRVDDAAYGLFKTAADGDRRTISNYIEHAALHYTLDNEFVDDSEMEWINSRAKDLKRSLADIQQGRYHFVD